MRLSVRIAIIHGIFSAFSDGGRVKAGGGRKDRKLQVCDLNAANSGRVSPLIAESDCDFNGFHHFQNIV